MSNLGLLTCRAGSTRLPGKNWRILDGMPLWQHCVKHMLASTLIDRVMVATDANEILDNMCEFPSVLTCRLPDACCIGSADRFDGFRFAVNEAEERHGLIIDYIVAPDATQPINTDGMMDRAIRQFMHDRADALMCVIERYPQYWLRHGDEFRSNWNAAVSRGCQEWITDGNPRLYSPKATCCIYTTEYMRDPSVSTCSNISMFEVSEIEGIDIDTLEDFELAEAVLQYQRRKV